MRIYISWKISGLPLPIATQFFEAAEKKAIKAFKLQGKLQDLVLVNPLNIPNAKVRRMVRINKRLTFRGLSERYTERDLWGAYMAEDLQELFKCEGIYMCKNWVHSTGATIEHSIAKELGLKIMYEQR